jgi:hypothetical protein
MPRTGRPKIEIDLDMVKRLAGIQCTMTEIAAVMDIGLSTLSTRKDFLEVYKKGLENGKASLRRIQFHLAEKSAGMAIWLGKQYLGQSDKMEIDPGDFMKELIEVIPDKDNKEVYSRMSKYIMN